MAIIPAMPASPALVPLPDPHGAPHGAFSAASALSDVGAAPAGVLDAPHIDDDHHSPAREPGMDSMDEALSAATVCKCMS